MMSEHVLYTMKGYFRGGGRLYTYETPVKSQVSLLRGIGQLTEAVNNKLLRERRIICSSETENSERFSKIFSVT